MALLKDPGPLPVRAEIEGVPFFPQKGYIIAAGHPVLVFQNLSLDIFP